MVASLATDTNDILLITNLFNNFPLYTTDKEVDSQTLSNDEIFKSVLNDAVKDNRDRNRIYLNINNLHFRLSFKPKIFEGISEDPFPISGSTSGFGNSNPVPVLVTKSPSINLPQNILRLLNKYPIQFKIILPNKPVQ